MDKQLVSEFIEDKDDYNGYFLEAFQDGISPEAWDKALSFNPRLNYLAQVAGVSTLEEYKEFRKTHERVVED